MYFCEKPLSIVDQPLILGFDVEWTKNYQIKNGNRAFCFSLVSVLVKTPWQVDTLEEEIDIGFSLYYANAEDECQSLCDAANRLIGQVLSDENTITGHQFSSDISVLLACSEHELPALRLLQQAWRTRNERSITRDIRVFDTRYDLPTSKQAASNKLVNVCPVWNLEVKQPEIQGSMTKMQKIFYRNQSSLIMEKIAVLNLRHSLSSIMLYLFHQHGRPERPVNINTILYRNLRDTFEYVRSEPFATLFSQPLAGSHV
jgi:hypothetical protein